MHFQSCICTMYSLECPNVIIYTQDVMVAVGLCSWMTHTFTSFSTFTNLHCNPLVHPVRHFLYNSWILYPKPTLHECYKAHLILHVRTCRWILLEFHPLSAQTTQGLATQDKGIVVGKLLCQFVDSLIFLSTLDHTIFPLSLIGTVTKKMQLGCFISA